VRRRFTDLMRKARESLAALVGADADDLVYVPNATTGLNIIAHSLLLREGDEVLSTDYEYGALDRTRRSICRKRGADLAHCTQLRSLLSQPVECLVHSHVVSAPGSTDSESF